MSDSTTGGNAWGEAWLDAQRKYFESWADIASKGMNPFEQNTPFRAGDANPLGTAYEQWWKMIEPGLPQQGRAAGERLREMNEGYMRLGEQIWKLAQNMQSATKGGQDWQQMMQEQLANWQKQFADQYAGGADWGAPWSQPLQQWQKLYSSFGMRPEEIEKLMHQKIPMDMEGLQRTLKGFLSTPAVGYTREMQEDWQKWGALWLDHVQVLERYKGLLSNTGKRSAEKVAAKLMELAKEGKTVTGLREAYDLWVECAEDAYGELAQGAEFVETQAELTNTLMAVRKHQQEMVESLLQAFDLPTRSELDTAHARIHALRKEVRNLKRSLEESNSDGMQQQIDELRSQLAELSQAAPASDTAPAKKKAAPRRSTTAKASPKTAPKKED
jgi:class III poly(R)-hydroxyalkanoic acid synthase PhaE subunit